MMIQMTTPTTTAEAIIPTHTPALKMPSITLQLLNRTSASNGTDNTVFFIIAVLVIIDPSNTIILFQITYHYKPKLLFNYFLLKHL